MARQMDFQSNPYVINIPRPTATRPSAPPFTLSNEHSYGYPPPPPPPPLPPPPPPYNEPNVNVQNHQNTSYSTESRTVLIVPVKQPVARNKYVCSCGSFFIVLLIIGIIWGIYRATMRH